MKTEIVPAILQKTYEEIAAEWEKIHRVAEHVQIDITDGVFAGEDMFREVRHFKQLPESDKIELHMMVHTPDNYAEDIIDLNPARCIFHIESFEGTSSLWPLYDNLAAETQTELALAVNPETPTERLAEYIALIDYVLFMGYSPGWANQPLKELVFNKIKAFRQQHPDMPIAVDGHVTLETLPRFKKSGATLFCANTAIFGKGDPVENYERLRAKAEAT